MRKFFVFFLSVVFMVIFACGLKQNAKSRIINDVADVKIDSLHYDLGEISMFDEDTVRYHLTNNSETPFRILYAKPSCGCMVVNYDDNDIEKGATTIISVVYRIDYVGRFENYVNVYANIKESPIELSFSGIGTNTK